MHVVSINAKISPTRNSKSAAEIQENFLFFITNNLKIYPMFTSAYIIYILYV